MQSKGYEEWFGPLGGARMNDKIDNQKIEKKMAIIREYLLSNISQCTIQDGPQADGVRTLLITFGGTGQRKVHVGPALLADDNQTTLELGWGLKDNNIAGKVLQGPDFYLTPDTVVPKD